jgi:hypothetical protein
MNQQKILQIYLRVLEYSGKNGQKILDFLNSNWPQHDWACVLKVSKLAPGISNLLMRRTGANTFPFCHDSIDSLNIAPPGYDNTFQKTFAEITDEQCCAWVKEKCDRPWLVFWSGGIDSTVIVSAILKNTTAADRENISIVCNRASIYELPRFFYNHVEPNFKLIQSPVQRYDLFKQYHVITGEFGDQLYGGGGLWEMMHQSPAHLANDIRQDPDALLDFMTRKIDREFAVWYYERMIENINSVNIPVETCHDFWWWQFFNYSHPSIYLDNISDHNFDKSTMSNHNYPDWYATDDYQQWSMNNNKYGVKYNLQWVDCKLPSKKYIYEFDHDPYGRVFKNKELSVQNKSWRSPQFCMLDDFSKLCLDQDLDRILELLADYIVT